MSTYCELCFLSIAGTPSPSDRAQSGPSPRVLELDSDSDRSAPGDSPYRLPESDENERVGIRGASSQRGASHLDGRNQASREPSKRRRKRRWDSPESSSRRGELKSSNQHSEAHGLPPEVVEGPLPTCPICLNEVAPKEKAVLQNCMHVFCAGCISSWSEIRRVCPLCKAAFTGWWYDIRGEHSYRERRLPSPPQKEDAQRGERSQLRRATEERFSARPYFYRLQRGLQSNRHGAPGGSHRADEQRQGGRRMEAVPRQRFFTQSDEEAQE